MPSLTDQLGDLTDVVDWWMKDRETPELAQLGTNIRLISIEDTSLDVTANALCATLTSKDAATVTTLRNNNGKLDHADWLHMCEATRDLTFTLHKLRSDPDDLRAQLPEPAQQVVDAIVECASDPGSRALISGPLAATACLLAYEIDPDSLYRIRPLTLGTSEAETLSWDYLRLKPVLPLRSGLPSEALAAIAVELINAGLQTQTAASQSAPQSDDPEHR